MPDNMTVTAEKQAGSDMFDRRTLTAENSKKAKTGLLESEMTAEETKTALANSEWLREHMGEAADFGVMDEQENVVELALDFDGDGRVESIFMIQDKSGSHKVSALFGSETQERGWDKYKLVSKRGETEGFGERVMGSLLAVSLDAKTILLCVCEEGPSDDPKTTFYSYGTDDEDAENFHMVGSVKGNIRRDCTLEDGVLKVWEECNHIMRDWKQVSYQIAENGELEEVEQDEYKLYSSTVGEGAELLVELPVYQKPEGEVVGQITQGKVYFFKISEREADDGDSKKRWFCLWNDTYCEVGWIEFHWDKERLQMLIGDTGLGEREVFANYVPVAE